MNHLSQDNRESHEEYLRDRIEALQRRLKELETENAKLKWDLHVTLVCHQERQKNGTAIIEHE